MKKLNAKNLLLINQQEKRSKKNEGKAICYKSLRSKEYLKQEEWH